MVERNKYKIKKIGNSKGIIINKYILDYLDLDVGDSVIIDMIKDNQVE